MEAQSKIYPSKGRAVRLAYEQSRRAKLMARGRCVVCSSRKEPNRRGFAKCATCAERGIDKCHKSARRATESYRLIRRIAKGEPLTVEQITSEAKRIVALYRDERRPRRQHLDIDELAASRNAQ